MILVQGKIWAQVGSNQRVILIFLVLRKKRSSLCRPSFTNGGSNQHCPWSERPYSLQNFKHARVVIGLLVHEEYQAFICDSPTLLHSHHILNYCLVVVG